MSRRLAESLGFRLEGSLDLLTSRCIPKPRMTRLLLPVILLAQRTREEYLIIRTHPGGEVAATGRLSVSTKGHGPSEVSARLDPAHAELASYLVSRLVRSVVTRAPGRRVEFSAAQWMEALIASAEKVGMQRRMTYRRMGLVLRD